MPEVKLSDGNVAAVRELEDMTRGDVRAAFKLADLDGANTGTGQLGMDTVGALQDAILVRFVETWTLTDKEGKPLAISMKTVKGLRLRDYNPLATAVAPVLAEVISGNSETPDPTSEEPSSASDSTEPASA
jgi:hypothetical protein